jgi:hypothetical protein
MLTFMGQPLVPHSGYRQRQAKLFNYVKTQGNYTEEIELDVPRDKFPSLSHSELQRETIRAMAANLRQRRLLAPAESVNALTVGAVHSDKSGIKGDGRNIDPYNADVPLPSPYNRVGLGFRNSIKPDVLFSGGRQFYRIKPGNVRASNEMSNLTNGSSRF